MYAVRRRWPTSQPCAAVTLRNTHTLTNYHILLTNDQVAAAKEEFFRIFEAALNGMIETRFMRDTAEVVL